MWGGSELGSRSSFSWVRSRRSPLASSTKDGHCLPVGKAAAPLIFRVPKGKRGVNAVRGEDKGVRGGEIGMGATQVSDNVGHVRLLFETMLQEKKSIPDRLRFHAEPSESLIAVTSLLREIQNPSNAR